MAAPLDGIRVIEVSNWLAAPAAAALMADLGAEVIKVEPPGGDVYRGFVLRSMGYEHDFATNYAFQLDNRGKRSMTVDLDKPGGPELVRTLAGSCDIFLTNLVQKRRLRFGLTYDDIVAVNPRVIYSSFSGYGTSGVDQDRPGFDFAAFWARSGIMSLMGEPDAPAHELFESVEVARKEGVAVGRKFADYSVTPPSALPDGITLIEPKPDYGLM